MKKIIFTAVVLGLSAFSFQSFAGEGVSYSAKKQGRVPFNKEQPEETTASVEENATAAEDLADLEPAAGAEDVAEENDTSSVAEDIKLPRKR